LSTREYTFKINGPFTALECVEEALNRCEVITQHPITSVTDITSIPNDKRVALLVEFVDGARVKLVVAPSDEFSVSSGILKLSPEVNVPRVLAVEKGWAAFEWIEGPTLRQHGLTDSLLHEAARLLLNIHSLKTTPSLATSESVLSHVQYKLRQNLPVLVENKIITEQERDVILNLAHSMYDQKFDISLIHGDFSPDNLVVRGADVFSVDNEKLTDYATDYDLCRAVSLWDEWNSSGSALLESYCEHSGRNVSRNDLVFWGVFDLTYRVSYRISLGQFNRFCIQSLRHILSTGEFR